jgi:hypothetical protein
MAERNNKQEEPMKKDDHWIDSSRYFFSFMPELAPLAPGETPSMSKDEVAKLMGAGTTFDPRHPIHMDYGVNSVSQDQHFVVDEYVGEW